MNRVEWEAMRGEQRRDWARRYGPGRRCIDRTDGSRCIEPAGTPWGPHWCARHDAERLARIGDSLDAFIRDGTVPRTTTTTKETP